MAVVTITTMSEQYCPLCSMPLSGAGKRACNSCWLLWGRKPPVIFIWVKAPWVSHVQRVGWTVGGHSDHVHISFS